MFDNEGNDERRNRRGCDGGGTIPFCDVCDICGMLNLNEDTKLRYSTKNNVFILI